MKLSTLFGFLAVTTSTTATKQGKQFRGTVTIKNTAPKKGTCQTPVWVGIHDGTFDLYDGGEPLISFMEPLVEDGNNAPITEAFSRFPGGLFDTTVGMGPICSGDKVTLDFNILVEPGKTYYFSYASMIIPSNDAFVANASPTATKIFDKNGVFKPVMIDVFGDEALDGGTEINDEIPENTAFFGQTVPNTGVTEHDDVTGHPGFNVKPKSILADPMFSNADFTVNGYQFMEISVAAQECSLTIKVVNAETNKITGTLNSMLASGTFCIPDYKLNFIASPTSGCPASKVAKLKLTGPIEKVRVDKSAPFSLFGDVKRNGKVKFDGRILLRGRYNLLALVFSGKNGNGKVVIKGEASFQAKKC